MIHVSLPNFFYIPLIIMLAGVGGVWLYRTLLDRLHYQRRPGSAKIYRCQVCDHVYIDHRDVPLSRCTRCTTLNEAVRR